MKYLFLMIAPATIALATIVLTTVAPPVLSDLAAAQTAAPVAPEPAPGKASSIPASVPASSAPASSAPASTIPMDQENARKARALIDQALQALGGQAYLNIHNILQQGRTYSFYHGRPTSNGVQFWRFVEYPDKERLEVTPQRDVAVVYSGEKGYEITYKGAHAIEKKDL